MSNFSLPKFWNNHSFKVLKYLGFLSWRWNFCFLFLLNFRKMSDGYELSDGIWHLFQALNNGGAEGTGANKLMIITRNFVGHKIPPAFISYLNNVQSDQLGSFPTSNDIIPCAIFLGLFLLIGIIHFSVFQINFNRGHYFYLSLVWVGYSAFNCIGWACRLAWATDITMITVGVVSEIFLIVPSIIIVSANLYLTQRLFAWRHPVGGSRRLFWNIMIGQYCAVLIIMALTIFVAVVPTFRFLSTSIFTKYRLINKISSILIILYSISSLILLALSYFYKPQDDDINLFTYQPWWLESFSPLYFVEYGAAQRAAETFLKRERRHRNAVRVIAATKNHYKVVEGVSNGRADLKHNISLGIIVSTTLLIFIGSIFRATAVLLDRQVQDGAIIYKPIFMYIVWGVFEVFVNLIYIIGRVDLRFYKPDRLPLEVRNLKTAEHSLLQSEEDLTSIDVIDDCKDEFEFKNSTVKSINKFHSSDDSDDFIF